MIAKVIQGIPFLIDPSTKRAYAYEKPIQGTPLYLGIYDAERETVQLVENWRELFQAKLEEYRQIERPRSRLPTQTR